jgi:hypothetical protein
MPGQEDEESQDQSDDQNEDEAHASPHGENFKSPRSKLRKKQAFRTNSKAKRSIFKETVSTKVKKQEKFHVNLESE